jgi:hypothetical protein
MTSLGRTTYNLAIARAATSIVVRRAIRISFGAWLAQLERTARRG